MSVESINGGADPRTWSRHLRDALSVRIIVMLALIALLSLLVHIGSDGVFLTPRNLSILLRQAAIIAIVAAGVSILLIMSEVDLSIGSAVYLVCVVIASAETQWQLPLYAIIPLAIGVGLALGAWNGFWVSAVGVPSFIVTLAGLLSFRGLGLYLTDARTISPLSDAHVALTESFISPQLSFVGGIVVFGVIAVILAAQSIAKQRQDSADGALAKTIVNIVAIFFVVAGFLAIVCSYRGTPAAILWTMAVGVTIWLLMSRTVFGRNAYMIGANRLAAQLAGISVNRNIFIGFLVMGVIYGVAGLLFTARLNASTAGDGLFMELDAIAAAVIGGVALSGGKGRIPVVLGGALLLTAIDNGMSVTGISSFLQQLIKGAILLGAVALDVRARSR
jgi:D-xylose transport system permease protein